MKKIFNKWYEAIIITQVGIGAFLLGGLFIHTWYDARKTTADIQLIPLEVEQQHSRQRVYASKQGRRYYPWWCDAGSAIVKENKVWYDTTEMAEQDGYTLAKGCR